MRIAVLIVLLAGVGAGCSNKGTGPSAPARPGSQPVSTARTSPGQEPAPEEPAAPELGDPVSSATPADLYAACADRLEQPEAAGECTTSDECAPAGCSAEKCITKVAAADLMSTCEVLPCFQAVEACACVEGQCRWSVRAEMPAAPTNNLSLPQ